MKPMRRHVLLGLGMASLAAASPVRAQPAYPTRTIRVVIPFGAGGGTDNLIRLLEPHVSRALGQPLVIENRAGSASIVGTEMVARAEPDGYTVLGVDSTFVINPGLFPSLPYDPARDLSRVGGN